MRTGIASTRRKIVAGLIGAAVSGVAISTLAEAPARSAPDPCAASEVARTIGSVAKSTGDYLDSHPETNQAMTAALQQPAGPQSLGSLKSYLEAHPKVAVDLQGIAQPMTKLSDQCKLPISLPQALSLAQAAQGATQGGAGLPNLPTGPLPGPARPNTAG
jgi:heme-binding protein